MGKHRSIYGPSAGRFISLEQAPLWGVLDFEDSELERRPNYCGQTRRLAEDTGGSLLDLAGGCVGVIVLEDDRGITCIALDEVCETLGIWSEDNAGESRGRDRRRTLPPVRSLTRGRLGRDVGETCMADAGETRERRLSV